MGEQSAIPNIAGIRRDVVEALQQLRPPVIRWPGGCFADGYHWEDGIGPREQRPVRVANRWGLDEIEPNSFGTHEFLELCRLVGAEPWINGNLGGGTPRELSEWVEYCNYAGNTTIAQRRVANGAPEPFGVRFWGIGNKCWEYGGKFRPDTYTVLHSLILTDGERDGERMALTPSYHVFDMYQGHRGGESLRVDWAAPEISFGGMNGEQRVPTLYGSASMQNGVLTLSVVNMDGTEPVEAERTIDRAEGAEIALVWLTHEDICAHNTFDQPNTLVPQRASVPAPSAGRGATLFPASASVFTVCLAR